MNYNTILKYALLFNKLAIESLVPEEKNLGDLELFIEKVINTPDGLEYNGLKFYNDEEGFFSNKSGNYISAVLLIDKHIIGGIDINITKSEMTVSAERTSYDHDVYIVKNPSLVDLNNAIIKLKEKKENLEKLYNISFADNNVHKKLGMLGTFLSKETDLLAYLKENIPHVIPPNLGNKLGSGAEGEVFEYGDDKIIKIMFVNSSTSANEIFNTLKMLKNNPSECTSKIYSYGNLARIGSHDMWGKEFYTDPHWFIYYIAERAFPIHKYDTDKIKDLLICLRNMNINPEDVKDNLNNVMQTKDGRYILVDFGDFTRLDFSQYMNVD